MSRTDTSRYYSIIFHFFVSDKITGKGEENCLFHLLDFFPRNIFCRLFLTDKLLLDKKPLSPISRQLKREVLFLQAIKSKLFYPPCLCTKSAGGSSSRPPHAYCTCIPSPLSRSRQTNWFLLLLRYQTASREFEKRKVFLPSFFCVKYN